MAELREALGPLWPYLIVIAIGFLPSEIWRVLGALASRGLDERSEVLVWVRAVATTLLAAVIAKLILTPGGALAAVPLAGRLAALAAGLAAFYAARRSAFAGIAVGEAALVALAWWAR